MGDVDGMLGSDELRLMSADTRLGGFSCSDDMAVGLVTPRPVLADLPIKPAIAPPCVAASALSLEKGCPVSAATLASLNLSLKLSLLLRFPSSSRSFLNCLTSKSADAAVFCRPRVSGGDFCGAGGCAAFLSPEVFLESHENGLLKPFGIEGSGEGLSAGTGGGDITCDGEIDRVVDDARDVSSGGLRDPDVCVVVLECAVDACGPVYVSIRDSLILKIYTDGFPLLRHHCNITVATLSR